VLLAVLALGTGCESLAPRPAEVQKPRIDLITPLPTAFDVALPRADLPVAVGGLSGIWAGAWVGADQAPAAGVPHTLIVKRVEGGGPAYAAPVIWSVGSPASGTGLGEPRFREGSAEVGGDGALALVLPDGGRAVYRLTDDHNVLAGELTVDGRVLRGTFRRQPEWSLPDRRGDASPAAPRHPG
jgi:hypothetical protein